MEVNTYKRHCLLQYLGHLIRFHTPADYNFYCSALRQAEKLFSDLSCILHAKVSSSHFTTLFTSGSSSLQMLNWYNSCGQSFTNAAGCCKVIQVVDYLQEFLILPKYGTFMLITVQIWHQILLMILCLFVTLCYSRHAQGRNVFQHINISKNATNVSSF